MSENTSINYWLIFVQINPSLPFPGQCGDGAREVFVSWQQFCGCWGHRGVSSQGENPAPWEHHLPQPLLPTNPSPSAQWVQASPWETLLNFQSLLSSGRRMQTAVRSRIKKIIPVSAQSPDYRPLGWKNKWFSPVWEALELQGWQEWCSGQGNPSPLPSRCCCHRFPSDQWKPPQSSYLEAVLCQRAEEMRTDMKWLWWEEKTKHTWRKVPTAAQLAQGGLSWVSTAGASPEPGGFLPWAGGVFCPSWAGRDPELRNDRKILKTSRASERPRGSLRLSRSRLLRHCSSPNPESKHAFRMMNKDGAELSLLLPPAAGSPAWILIAGLSWDHFNAASGPGSGRGEGVFALFGENQVALLNPENFCSWNKLWMLLRGVKGWMEIAGDWGGIASSIRSACESAALALTSTSNLQIVQICFSQFTSPAKWPQIYSLGVHAQKWLS